MVTSKKFHSQVLFSFCVFLSHYFRFHSIFQFRFVNSNVSFVYVRVRVSFKFITIDIGQAFWKFSNSFWLLNRVNRRCLSVMLLNRRQSKLVTVSHRLTNGNETDDDSSLFSYRQFSRNQRYTNSSSVRSLHLSVRPLKRWSAMSRILSAWPNRAHTECTCIRQQIAFSRQEKVLSFFFFSVETRLHLTVNFWVHFEQSTT